MPLALAAVLWWRRRRPSGAGIPYPDLDVIAGPPRPGRARAATCRSRWPCWPSPGSPSSLARPEVCASVPRERATIMLAIDVSGSMAADDVAPYRLRAAQDAALTFAEEVPRQYQVGLVSFSGQAQPAAWPPTTDRARPARGPSRA